MTTTQIATRYTSKDARRAAEVLYERMGVELPGNTRMQIITLLAAALFTDTPAFAFRAICDETRGIR